jgi:hypothetical protein
VLLFFPCSSCFVFCVGKDKVWPECGESSFVCSAVAAIGLNAVFFSESRPDQTLKKLHQKENKKNKSNHNNKEKKPRGGSIYKLPVFSASALNTPVFAVISPGRAASEFLRSTKPLSHPPSVRPVDAIAEPSPCPLQLRHPLALFYFNSPLPLSLTIR